MCIIIYISIDELQKVKIFDQDLVKDSSIEILYECTKQLGKQSILSRRRKPDYVLYPASLLKHQIHSESLDE